ncbi:uncharacterized protein LOC136073920 [Hydra vulgaris]|uniref:uncharacterized protein LOC136073920 n=1 Tax=Hydra vulgaris TaxID=6087 RepID=UPI0032EA769B
MLDINKKSYTHKYVVGKSGVFTDVNNMHNQAKSSDFFRALSGYTHKYEVGGYGLFTPFLNMFNKQALSNALNSSRIIASRAAATDLGKTAIDAAKSAGKELATSAISTAKEIVINKGEIRIFIENSDSLFHPHESYLKIEGRLVKADRTSYANTDAITLAHNGLMPLFDRIEYKFYDSVVESVSFPGKATTMLGIQQFIIQKPTTKGSFELNIPLRHIFKFCDDYEKVFYGLKHELYMLRASDNNAIFRDAGVAAGRVDTTRISLMMRRATPSVVADLELAKIIKSHETLDIGFRSRFLDRINVPQNTTFTWPLGIRTTEKPRFILVGFQTNREGNQEQNASIFDHCDLKNMYIELNEERYPATNYNLSFPNMKFTRAYRHVSNFAEDYYNMSNLISLCGITPSDYKDLYPIMYFDVSKQSEKMKDSTVDITLKAEFNTPVPANTIIFALIISDRIAKITSNGNKLRFEY